MRVTRKVIESLAKKRIKAWSLQYDDICTEMAKDASKEQKDEIIQTNMKLIKKLIKKYGVEYVKDMIKMEQMQFRFIAKHGPKQKKQQTRKRIRSCIYSKKQGSYIMHSERTDL